MEGRRERGDVLRVLCGRAMDLIEPGTTGLLRELGYELRSISFGPAGLVVYAQEPG